MRSARWAGQAPRLHR